MYRTRCFILQVFVAKWCSCVSVSSLPSVPSHRVAPVVRAVPVSTASSAPKSSRSACIPANACAELERNIAVETVRIEPSESQLTSDNSGSYLWSYVTTGELVWEAVTAAVVLVV